MISRQTSRSGIGEEGGHRELHCLPTGCVEFVFVTVASFRSFYSQKGRLLARKGSSSSKVNHG